MKRRDYGVNCVKIGAVIDVLRIFCPAVLHVFDREDSCIMFSFSSDTSYLQTAASQLTLTTDNTSNSNISIKKWFALKIPFSLIDLEQEIFS
jgi:hypothetical protein